MAKGYSKKQPVSYSKPSKPVRPKTPKQGKSRAKGR